MSHRRRGLYRSRRCLAVIFSLGLGLVACAAPGSYGGGGDDGDSGGNGGGGTESAGVSLLGGGWHNFQGMATTNYYGLFHGFRGTAYDEVESRVGAAGTVTGFAAAITSAPPTGSWVFTLFKNGAAQAMSCSIAGSDDECLDAAGCVEVAVGDEIAVEVVPSGATANAGGPRWTAVLSAGASCP